MREDPGIHFKDEAEAAFAKLHWKEICWEVRNYKKYPYLEIK